MFDRTGELLDRIKMQLRNSHERVAASAEVERVTDVYLKNSRSVIDDSRRLLAGLRSRSGVSATICKS
jgi:hypothetical protein